MKILCGECIVEGKHPEMVFKGGISRLTEFVDICYACSACGKAVRIHVNRDEEELYLGLLKEVKKIYLRFPGSPCPYIFPDIAELDERKVEG